MRTLPLFVLFLLLLLGDGSLLAQSFDNRQCFEKMIREGEVNLNQKRFFEALECFDLAGKCYDILPGKQEALIERWRQTTKQRINALVQAEEQKTREAQQAALAAKNLVATFKTNNGGIRRLATKQALQLTTNGSGQESYVKEIYLKIHKQATNEISYPEFTMVLDTTSSLKADLSNDGKKLAIVSQKNSVFIWDLETGIPDAWMTKFQQQVLGLFFIPNTPFLLVTMTGGAMLLDIEKRRVFKTFPNQYFFHYATFSSNKLLYHIDKRDPQKSNTVYTYNTNDFSLKDSLKFNEAISTMVLSPDESTLAIGSGDTLFFLDAVTFETKLYKVIPTEKMILFGLFSPNGRYYAQKYYGNYPADIFDLKDSLQSHTISPLVYGIHSFAFHPNNKEILTINSDLEAFGSSISLFHFPQKDSITYTWLRNVGVTFAEFDKSGEHLLLQGNDNNIEILKMGVSNEFYLHTEFIKEFKEDSRILKILYPPSKDFIIIISDNNIINKWNIKQEDHIGSVDDHCFAEDAVITDDGSIAITIERDRQTLKCWDTKSRQQLKSSKLSQQVSNLTIFNDELVLSAKDSLLFYSLPELNLIRALSFEKPINGIQGGVHQLAVVSDLGRKLSLIDKHQKRKNLLLTEELLLNYPVELNFNSNETHLMIEHLKQCWVVQLAGLKMIKEIKFDPTTTFCFAFAHKAALCAYSLDNEISISQLSNLQVKYQLKVAKNCKKLLFEKDDKGLLYLDENNALHQSSFLGEEGQLLYTKECHNVYFTKNLESLLLLRKDNNTKLSGEGEIYLLDADNYLYQSFYKVKGRIHTKIQKARQANISIINIDYYGNRTAFLDLNDLQRIPDYNLPALQHYGIYLPPERWLEVDGDAKKAKYYAKYLEQNLDYLLKYQKGGSKAQYLKIIEKLKAIAKD